MIGRSSGAFSVCAALDCVSSGDVGACGETLLDIAGSFAGGLAGKILAKYGTPWKWVKDIKLAKRVTGLVGDPLGGASGDTVELTANRHFDKRQHTHDLTIVGIHAYYVLAGARRCWCRTATRAPAKQRHAG